MGPVTRAMLDSAEANQIRPQLAAKVFDPNAPAAGAIAEELDVAVRAILGRGMFMAGELLRVLDALRIAHIQAVPFKGPVFAALLGDGPGAREMYDLDILVRPEDVVEAAKVLVFLGYSASVPPHAISSPWLTKVTSELVLAHRGELTMFELHWRLSPRWYPSPCTVDDVMARLTEQEVFGGRVRWPAAEELLLVHVADGMKSCGNGMRWIADVVRVLRHHGDFDWARIRRIASRGGGLNSVRVALAVADELAGDLACRLGVPQLALSLAPPAQALAREATCVARLAQAVRSIRRRVLSDVWNTTAMAHFRWALQLADDRAQAAGEIVRYLGGPTIVDLAAMPEQGESDLALRRRALRRRLGR